MLNGIVSTRLASVSLLSWKKKTFLFLSESICHVSTIQCSIGFLSFANGGNIVNMPLIERILQVTVSSKTDIIGGKEEGGTITNKRKLEGPVSQPKSMGLV